MDKEKKKRLRRLISRWHLDKLFWILTSPAYRSYLIHFDNTSEFVRNEFRLRFDLLYLKRKYGKFLACLPLLPVGHDHPHIIWWCWFQGEKSAPDLCKSCLRSLRHFYPDYKIRIITEDNINEYIEIPQFVLEKYKKGIIGKAHFSDIIRAMLLSEYGGTWIDSTVLCTGRDKGLFDNDFFVFQDWKFNQDLSSVASNWLISSVKAHPIIVTVKELLIEYWKEHNYTIDYFFFHLFFHMVTEKYSEIWKCVPKYSNIPPHFLQFEIGEQFTQKRWDEICMMSDFHKLNYDISLGDTKGSFYEFITRGVS